VLRIAGRPAEIAVAGPVHQVRGRVHDEYTTSPRFLHQSNRKPGNFLPRQSR
jgi:hypothetical protein